VVGNTTGTRKQNVLAKKKAGQNENAVSS